MGEVEPIALVGLACRLPDAPDAQAFWELLLAGHNVVRPLPGTRPGTTGVVGGYLDDVASFDADFFGISAREAVRLDPQHRVLLETCWEAFEDAGLTAEALAGSRTSVHTTTMATDYWELLRDAGIEDIHTLLGSAISGTAAGRVSHLLDLRGPSMSVDAACTSGLLAVHLACQGLRTGEVDIAVAAACNLLLGSGYWQCFYEGGVLAPDGRCKFGSTDADGYGRSEGSAAVVLKRLSDAVADGDRVHAVIMSSATGHNGRTSSWLAAPAALGQADATRRAHQLAGVRPDEVDYVEAHGTGTTAGDQEELAGLTEVLGHRDQPCLVGSVKSAVGHTEVAAGLVGLIKTVLALRHGVIPATHHGAEQHALLSGGPLELVTSATPWPDSGRRVAGVSSTGISGTNVHLVLTEAPTIVEVPAQRPARYVLPVSARCVDALHELADRYADLLEDNEIDPVDVCYSAARHRTRHHHRLVVEGASRAELVERLRARQGAEVGWAGPEHGRFVELPAYPWQRRRFWVDTPLHSGVPVAPRTAEEFELFFHDCVEQVAGAPADPSRPLTQFGDAELLAHQLRTHLADRLHIRVPLRPLRTAPLRLLARQLFPLAVRKAG